MLSHPVWVRGLKLSQWIEAFVSWRSHPVWVRGLKRAKMAEQVDNAEVAPRVGAWIETFTTIISFSIESVAPRVGAWIETHNE